jgi:hypothetical protein
VSGSGLSNLVNLEYIHVVYPLPGLNFKNLINLTHINLDSNGIDIRSLSGLRHLSAVVLHRSTFQYDPELTCLMNSSETLEKLSMFDSQLTTDACFANVPNVKSLNIGMCEGITGDGFKHLKRLQYLTFSHVDKSKQDALCFLKCVHEHLKPRLLSLRVCLNKDKGCGFQDMPVYLCDIPYLDLNQFLVIRGDTSEEDQTFNFSKFYHEITGYKYIRYVVKSRHPYGDTKIICQRLKVQGKHE